MKGRLLAGAAIAAVAAVSVAYGADLGQPYAPPYIPSAPQSVWSGCHIGVNGGLGALHTQWADTQIDGNIDGSGTTAQTAHLDGAGGVAGGQFGCDMQFGSFVLGVAGSYDISDITGTNQDQFNSPWTLRDNIDWFATATGRVGVAANNFLIYGKGGVAYAHNNFEIENTGVTLGTPSDVRTGWTAGAGIEWAFAGHWSAVLEANYYAFPSKTELFNNPTAVAGGFVNAPFTINVQPSFETVTFGLNYRFGGM
jgi:outer membrane immunogenic protein